jgi:hypothetical protein
MIACEAEDEGGWASAGSVLAAPLNMDFAQGGSHVQTATG